MFLSLVRLLGGDGIEAEASVVRRRQPGETRHCITRAGIRGDLAMVELRGRKQAGVAGLG